MYYLLAFYTQLRMYVGVTISLLSTWFLLLISISTCTKGFWGRGERIVRNHSKRGCSFIFIVLFFFRFWWNDHLGLMIWRVLKPGRSMGALQFYGILLVIIFSMVLISNINFFFFFLFINLPHPQMILHRSSPSRKLKNIMSLIRFSYLLDNLKYWINFLIQPSSTCVQSQKKLSSDKSNFMTEPRSRIYY